MLRKLKIYGLIAIILISIASTIGALPSEGHDTKYYSDGTFDTIVGEYYADCNGQESWGVRSAYVERDSWSCPTGDHIGPCTRKYCPGWSSQWSVPAGPDGPDWDCQTWSCEY